MTATMDKPRVLVVDDNHDAATTLSFLLETAGYEVETCFDGVHALEAAGEFAPDACVLDINMPGMDGYELAKKLRERDPEHAPVFATVTAYEDYTHLEKSVEAGFDLHFTKPADYLEVASQLAQSIRKMRPNVKTAEQIEVDTAEVPALNMACDSSKAAISEKRAISASIYLAVAGVMIGAILILGKVVR